MSARPWWQVGYPGGPMVAVKGFPRPLYPPGAAGYTASKPGPDVEGYKRTISRAGRWPWQVFDQDFHRNFSLGLPGGNVGETGVAGVQRQLGLQATGYVGLPTFNGLRSIRIPAGLPNAGEPAMDARAVQLINTAYDLEQRASSAPGASPRDRAMAHMRARLGYTEQPPLQL